VSGTDLRLRGSGSTTVHAYRGGKTTVTPLPSSGNIWFIGNRLVYKDVFNEFRVIDGVQGSISTLSPGNIYAKTNKLCWVAVGYEYCATDTQYSTTI
jgi:hypothetical protein